MKPIAVALIVCLAFLASPACGQTEPGHATAPAGPPDEPGFALTVYSTADPAFDWMNWEQQRAGNPYAYQAQFPGYGVVRETRRIDLTEGRNTVRFTGVAASIDPTTLRFRSLDDPEASILEQSYEYDLLNAQKLLEKFGGKTVTLNDNGQPRQVTLLSVRDGNLIYREGEDGPVRMRGSSYAGTFLDQVELPDTAGLILEPTLVWDMISGRAGEQLVQVTYEAARMTWRADYTVVTNADDTAVDVGAWVTLVNRSGMSYPEARLKLIAGDVQRVTPAGSMGYEDLRRRGSREEAAGATGFSEKSFFEYHMYTLGRPTSLADNSTKQIELFPAVRRVPARKVFVYYGLPNSRSYWFAPNPAVDRDLGLPMNKQVDIYLRFANAEESGMGIPLPAGRLRVYKRDEADDTLEFIGEDVISHTPREEEVLVRLGSAFDIVGERRQMDFRVNHAERWMEEDIEVKLRNRKAEPVQVIVKENLYRWVNWEITRRNHDFEKQDARTVHFTVDAQPDEEATVSYTVRYTW